MAADPCPPAAAGAGGSGERVFILAAGELGATLIVAPPGRATLTMKIYTYLHYGASEAVAGLCLSVAAVALLGGLVGVLMVGRWRLPRAKRFR